MRQNDVCLAEQLEAIRAEIDERIKEIELQNTLTEQQRDFIRWASKVYHIALGFVWLTNGAVKYLAVPVGVLVGIYMYGYDLLEIIAQKMGLR